MKNIKKPFYAKHKIPNVIKYSVLSTFVGFHVTEECFSFTSVLLHSSNVVTPIPLYLIESNPVYKCIQYVSEFPSRKDWRLVFSYTQGFFRFKPLWYKFFSLDIYYLFWVQKLKSRGIYSITLLLMLDICRVSKLWHRLLLLSFLYKNSL